jgi:hypothetical protein
MTCHLILAKITVGQVGVMIPVAVLLTWFFKHLLFDTLGVNGVNMFLLEKVLLDSELKSRCVLS